MELVFEFVYRDSIIVVKLVESDAFVYSVVIFNVNKTLVHCVLEATFNYSLVPRGCFTFYILSGRYDAEADRAFYTSLLFRAVTPSGLSIVDRHQVVIFELFLYTSKSAGIMVSYISLDMDGTPLFTLFELTNTTLSVILTQ